MYEALAYLAVSALFANLFDNSDSVWWYGLGSVITFFVLFCIGWLKLIKYWIS